MPTSARPSVHWSRFAGARFGPRGWIRQRENNGAVRVRGHFTHDIFSESARLAGDADQHRRLARCARRPADAISSATRKLPAFHFGSLLRLPAARWHFARLDSPAAFDQQTIAINGVKPFTSFCFGQALLLHNGDQKIGDTDARRAEAEAWRSSGLSANAGRVDGCEKRRGGDGRGALNIVIEGAELVAIARRAGAPRWRRRSPPIAAGRAASGASRRRRRPRQNRRTPGRGRARAASRDR